MEGMGGGAVGEEGDIAQPRDRRQLFEIFPLTVFLAEGKDGQARWECWFAAWCLLGTCHDAGRLWWVLVPW